MAQEAKLLTHQEARIKKSLFSQMSCRVFTTENKMKKALSHAARHYAQYSAAKKSKREDLIQAKQVCFVGDPHKV